MSTTDSHYLFISDKDRKNLYVQAIAKGNLFLLEEGNADSKIP